MRKFLSTLAIAGLSLSSFAVFTGTASASCADGTAEGGPDAAAAPVGGGLNDSGDGGYIGVYDGDAFIEAYGDASGDGAIHANGSGYYDGSAGTCDVPVEGTELAPGATLYADGDPASQSGYVVLAGDESTIHGYVGVDSSSDTVVTADCGDYSEGNGASLAAPGGDSGAPECIG